MTDPQTDPGAADDAQKNRDIAAVGYIWVLSVIVFFAKKESPFVRFHARQGIVLFILSIISWMIPLIGRYIELVILALGVLGFLAAAQGQWKELPLIGPLSRNDMVGVRRSWRELLDGFLRGWKEAKKGMTRESHPTPSQKSTVAPGAPSPVGSAGTLPLPPVPKP